MGGRPSSDITHVAATELKHRDELIWGLHGDPPKIAKNRIYTDDVRRRVIPRPNRLDNAKDVFLRLWSERELDHDE